MSIDITEVIPLVEWSPTSTIFVTNVRPLVEIVGASEQRITQVIPLVETAIPEGLLIFGNRALVEWLQGNEMTVEHSRVEIQTTWNRQAGGRMFNRTGADFSGAWQTGEGFGWTGGIDEGGEYGEPGGTGGSPGGGGGGGSPGGGYGGGYGPPGGGGGGPGGGSGGGGDDGGDGDPLGTEPPPSSGGEVRYPGANEDPIWGP